MDDITQNKRFPEEKISIENEMYHILFENANDAIFILENNKFIECNDMTLKIYGCKKGDDIIGYFPWDFSPRIQPDGQPSKKKALDILKACSNGDSQRFYWKHIRMDGTPFDAQISLNCFRLEGKEYIQAIVRDISEIKKAGEALKFERDFNKNLIESSPAYFVTINNQLKTVMMNSAMLAAIGYSNKEVIGTDYIETFVPERDRKQILEVFEEHILRKRKNVNQNHIITKEGEELLVEWYSCPIINQKGNVDFFFGVGIDITEKKKTEDELINSEKRFRTLFMNAGIGIALVNTKGHALLCNPVLCKMLGYLEEELKKMHFTDFTYPNDRDKDLRFFKEIVDGKINNYSIEKRFIRKDKSVLWTNLTVSAVRDKHCNLQNIIKMIVDITDRKLREEEMKKALMKFKLDLGNLYLVLDKTSDLSIEAFNDILKAGYNGIAISRTTKEKFRQLTSQNFQYLWLAEKKGLRTLEPNLKKIYQYLDILPKKCAILIDRLDYLISKNGFKKTLDFIHSLRELAYYNEHAIIISVDPLTIDERQHRLLEKESSEIELREKIKVSPDQLDVLKYLHERNLLGIKPTFSDIEMDLKMSKPTVRKRLRVLMAEGYVIISDKGRTKIVELNEKGRRLFYK